MSLRFRSFGAIPSDAFLQLCGLKYSCSSLWFSFQICRLIVLHWGWFWSPGNIWQCLETFLTTFGGCYWHLGFPDSSVGKKFTCNAGDPRSIPRLGKSPGEGKGYPLQHSCLENPMDRSGRLQFMGLQRVGHDWMTSLSIVQLGRMIEKHKGFMFLVELALLSKVGLCGNSFKFIDTLHKVQPKFNPKLISKQTFLYWFITESDR